MTADEARRALDQGEEEEAPVLLTPSILAKLTKDDVPEGVSLQVGTMKDGVIHLEWEGRMYKAENEIIVEAEYSWTRKYWYSPLGLEQYMDLVRRAVETRHRLHQDVELTNYDDDGAFIHLTFAIHVDDSRDLGIAFGEARRVTGEIEEAAQQASDEVGTRIAQVAARLSGWGSNSLDSLVDEVATAKSTDDRGRSLEELCSRLFETIPGFTVTGRLRTATEEIDISILNDSNEPRLRRESALLLAECKNWSGKCGKNELVLFREKIENRNRRCSLGFLISWNGFANTVTKEMLRGSREDTLIVPISGDNIRSAVRSADFVTAILSAWDRAVTL